MNSKVDWSFIRKLEGWVPKGYMPKDLDGDNSGVTIAAGFDIGQHSFKELENLHLSVPLLAKLKDYAGLKGQAARNMLNKRPLTLTTEELGELDSKVKEDKYRLAEKEYNENSDFTFEFLSKEQQTVVVSVAFQYGSLKKKCPHFFRFVTKGQWKCACAELENFGDAYHVRRMKEASLLRQGLKIDTKEKLKKC